MALIKVGFSINLDFTNANTLAASHHEYYVDMLEIEPQYEGDDFVYLDDAAEVEIRRMRMIFRLSGVPEAVSDGAPSWFSLWRSMIGNTDTVLFFPTGATPTDTDTTGTLDSSVFATEVIGTSRHRPKVYGTSGSRRIRKTSLNFAEKQYREPTDSHFNSFDNLIPNL